MRRGVIFRLLPFQSFLLSLCECHYLVVYRPLVKWKKKCPEGANRASHGGRARSTLLRAQTELQRAKASVRARDRNVAVLLLYHVR